MVRGRLEVGHSSPAGEEWLRRREGQLVLLGGKWRGGGEFSVDHVIMD